MAELAQHGELSPTLTATGIDTGQVQVITDQHVVVAVSPGLAATVRLDVFPAPPAGAQAAATVPGPVVGGSGSTHYRVVARTVDTPAGTLTVYAASSLRAAEKSVAALVAGLWVGLPLLTLLAAVGIWLVVGRSLSPVERMRREVAAISGSRLDERISAHACRRTGSAGRNDERSARASRPRRHRPSSVPGRCLARAAQPAGLGAHAAGSGAGVSGSH